MTIGEFKKMISLLDNDVQIFVGPESNRDDIASPHALVIEHQEVDCDDEGKAVEPFFKKTVHILY